MKKRAQRDADLSSVFLGPKAENADVFERLLLEAFRDHVFWRRNFHPEDGFSISEQDRRGTAFQDGVSRLSEDLLTLLGLLKDGVPFHSPRYVGHMAADNSMAAVIGYFAAMLYNPNNVVAEAAPVTTRLELEATGQLATMIGYPADTHWSHLTSGGTVANFEALWLARNVKYLPVALRWAAQELGLEVPITLADQSEQDVRVTSLWQLLNIPSSAALDAADRFVTTAATPQIGHAALSRWSLAGQGAQEFQRRLTADFGHPLPPAVVLVPSTAHYSWEKMCRALGIGAANLRKVPVDDQFRMDVSALERILRGLRGREQAVIACVTVAGTTEESAVDQVDQIVDVRNRLAKELGVHFHLHADAAYGGYAASITRGRDGERRSFAAARADYAPAPWPSRETYDALTALEHTDSITIDPHKLGYVPYPAGAICVRDGRARHLVSAEAPYAFSEDRQDLGRFIFEGSKPGAAAAAVWMAHRALPLNAAGYGHLIGETAKGALRLHEAVRSHDFAPFRVVMLPEPDLNIVCFTFRHPTLRTLAENNAFIERVHRAMSAGGKKSARQLDYFVSHTTLRASEYGTAGERWAKAADFEGDQYWSSGGVAVLRCTVMKPYQADARVDFLREFVRTLHDVLKENLGTLTLRTGQLATH